MGSQSDLKKKPHHPSSNRLTTINRVIHKIWNGMNKQSNSPHPRDDLIWSDDILLSPHLHCFVSWVKSYESRTQNCNLSHFLRAYLLKRPAELGNQILTKQEFTCMFHTLILVSAEGGFLCREFEEFPTWAISDVNQPLTAAGLLWQLMKTKVRHEQQCIVGKYQAVNICT